MPTGDVGPGAGSVAEITPEQVHDLLTGTHDFLARATA
jgi:hypothetical protein